MTNFIVHEYFGVSPDVVWGTIREDLPDVVIELRRLIDDSQTWFLLGLCLRRRPHLRERSHPLRGYVTCIPEQLPQRRQHGLHAALDLGEWVDGLVCSHLDADVELTLTSLSAASSTPRRLRRS